MKIFVILAIFEAVLFTIVSALVWETTHPEINGYDVVKCEFVRYDGDTLVIVQHLIKNAYGEP